MKLSFSTTGESEEDIYPVTVTKIADAQRIDSRLRKYFRPRFKSDPKNKISLKVMDDVDVLVYDQKRLVIPTKLQHNVVKWYHHYLQHPGFTRLCTGRP